MNLVTTERTPSSADRPRAVLPPARAYCRKHAFAPFSPNVSPGTQVQGCSPSSRHVSYDLPPSLAVERSVGRYYDPQTGQFLSVDPLVAETEQPYAYTGGDPVNGTDPSGDIFVGALGQGNGFNCPAELGLPPCYYSQPAEIRGGTEGICVNGSAYLLDSGGNVQVCLVEEGGNRQVGATVTLGSYTSVSASLLDRISGFVSNILHLVAVGASLTYQRSTANNLCQLGGPFVYESTSIGLATGSYFEGRGVEGIDLGGGLSLLPGNVEVGKTFTIVKEFSPGSSQRDAAIAAIDAYTENPFALPIRAAAAAFLGSV